MSVWPIFCRPSIRDLRIALLKGFNSIDHHSIPSPFKITNVRKVSIFFLTATVIGLFSLISCSKSNNTTTTTPDSVFTSPWITLAFDTVPADGDWEETISAPAITSAILDNGVVLGYGAYLDVNNDTVVSQPIEFDIFQTFYAGNIFLQSGPDNSGLWYRYVTVPGHVLTTKGLTPIQAKSLSYAEITKLFPPAAKSSSSPTIR
jgi:hypothetical protein